MLVRVLKPLAVVLGLGLVGASAVMASPFGGPKFNHSRVEAFSTDVYRVDLHGDEYTEIEVRGDGDTDLDLFVYDQYGNLIVSDTDYGDYCSVWVLPYRASTWRIEIVNLGNVYNEYTIEVY